MYQKCKVIRGGKQLNITRQNRDIPQNAEIPLDVCLGQDGVSGRAWSSTWFWGYERIVKILGGLEWVASTPPLTWTLHGLPIKNSAEHWEFFWPFGSHSDFWWGKVPHPNKDLLQWTLGGQLAHWQSHMEGGGWYLVLNIKTFEGGIPSPSLREKNLFGKNQPNWFSQKIMFWGGFFPPSKRKMIGFKKTGNTGQWCGILWFFFKQALIFARISSATLWY